MREAMVCTVGMAASGAAKTGRDEAKEKPAEKAGFLCAAYLCAFQAKYSRR